MLFWLFVFTGAGFVAGVWVGFGAGWKAAMRFNRDRTIGRAVDQYEQDIKARKGA